MKISKFIEHLKQLNSLTILNANGTLVPQHFHITEAGLTTRHFIDCGSTIRIEKFVNLQVWVAGDVEHRLAPSKLIKILDIAQPFINDGDLEVEIEYQGDTIGRYGLDFLNGAFQLLPKQTNCLASDHCGIPDDKMKLELSSLKAGSSCCAPGGGCC